MEKHIPPKIFFLLIFCLPALDVTSQKSVSEKVKFHLNTTSVPEAKKPDIQIISPVGLKSGSTFQSEKQLVTLGIRLINNGVNTRVYLNNTEIPPSGAGDVLIKEIELKNGTNPIILSLRDNEKLIKEEGFSLLYIPQVKNISPLAVNTGKFYALIVANGNYISPDVPQLRRPVPDARALKEILTTKYSFNPENVYFLPDMKRANLIMALDELQTKLNADDNLLIYYAGHGKMDEESGRGYWLLADAIPSSRVDWFSNSNLIDYIRGFKARHILLIADACFAGSVFYARGVFDDAPPPIQDIFRNRSRTAMTSGGTTEVNDESKFSELLLLHLRENRDKYLTSSHLFRDVENSVTSTNSTAPRFGIIQDANDMHGDFVFILNDDN